MKTRSLLAAGAALVAIGIVPASALATDTQLIGTVGTELTAAIGTPVGTLSLTHATPGTQTLPVTVTSTSAAWTLNVKDNTNTSVFLGHTTGKMGKCTALGVPVLNQAGTALAGQLTNTLQWNGGDQSSLTNITGSDLPVKAVTTTGLGVTTVNVGVSQSLANGDAVAATDAYCLTLGFTVS
jgi:hypothetical protein